MPKKADPGQTDMFVSDTRSHKYSIILHPDWNTSQKIKGLKDLLKNQIGRDPHDLHTPPHITLYECTSERCMDSYILEQVKEAIKLYEKFPVHIGGPDYWDSGGTFFLRINEPKIIQQMARSIKTSIKPLKKSAVRESLKVPHITISRYITRKEISRLSLADYAFTGIFVCIWVSVLKKAGDEGFTSTVAKLRLS